MPVPPPESDDATPAPSPPPMLTVEEQTRLAQTVMRRQGALSLRVAAVFVILLLGLPLFNLYKPEWATAPIFGFPATWLFLGVLFYPITVLLSIYFVRHSDRIEAEQTLEAGTVRNAQ